MVNLVALFKGCWEVLGARFVHVFHHTKDFEALGHELGTEELTVFWNVGLLRYANLFRLGCEDLLETQGILTSHGFPSELVQLVQLVICKLHIKLPIPYHLKVGATVPASILPGNHPDSLTNCL